MKIGASNRTRFGPASQRRSAPPAVKAEDRCANLPAVIEPPLVRHAPAPAFRSHSALIAQLVAVRENMPVARALRREDPAVGAGAYRAVAALDPTLEAHEQRKI